MLNTLIIIMANYLFLLLPAIGAVWFLRLPRALQKEVVVIGLLTGALALLLAG